MRHSCKFGVVALAANATICRAQDSGQSESGASWEIVIGVAIVIVGLVATIFYNAYSGTLKQRFNFSILNAPGIIVALIAEILLFLGLSPDSDQSMVARVILALIGAVLLIGLVAFNAAQTSGEHALLVTFFQCIAAFLIMLAVVMLMLALGKSSKKRR